MRFITACKALAVTALFTVCAFAQNKINPQTQINWPQATCAASGTVYSPSTNTCVVNNANALFILGFPVISPNPIPAFGDGIYFDDGANEWIVEAPPTSTGCQPNCNAVTLGKQETPIVGTTPVNNEPLLYLQQFNQYVSRPVVLPNADTSVGNLPAAGAVPLWCGTAPITTLCASLISFQVDGIFHFGTGLTFGTFTGERQVLDSSLDPTSPEDQAIFREGGSNPSSPAAFDIYGAVPQPWVGNPLNVSYRKLTYIGDTCTDLNQGPQSENQCANLGYFLKGYKAEVFQDHLNNNYVVALSSTSAGGTSLQAFNSTNNADGTHPASGAAVIQTDLPPTGQNDAYEYPVLPSTQTALVGVILGTITPNHMIVVGADGKTLLDGGLPSPVASQAVTFTPLAAAGTGATAACLTGVSCTTKAGVIAVQFGTASLSAGDVFTINWTTALPIANVCTLQVIGGTVYGQDTAAMSTTKVTVKSLTAPAVSQNTQFIYTCGGGQ